MKIEVKERGSKSYYDEFLFVVNKYRSLLKKPNVKVSKLTVFLKQYLLLILLSIIIFIASYIFTYDILFILFTGMLSILFIFSIYYLILINKRINYLMNETGSKIININKDYVEYSDEDKSYKVKWENIKYVIINKYSICFMPYLKSEILISISTDYKDKILNAIKKYQKEKILIDNSNLY